jgi:hypothetical protein
MYADGQSGICGICGEECSFFIGNHLNCERKWREENGEPIVSGVVCDEKTTSEELTKAVSEAKSKASSFSSIVVWV